MFETYIELFNSNLPRAIVITICTLTILSSLIFISIIDIKKQTIKFKWLLLSGFLIIFMTFIAAFFCGCKYLKWFIILALPLWFIILFLNSKLNKNRIVGKADVDIISAVFSLNVMYSFWLFFISQHKAQTGETLINVSGIEIMRSWYMFLLYFLIGAIFYIGICIITFAYKALINKINIFILMKTSKVPVVPMLIPISIGVPIMIMFS